MKETYNQITSILTENNISVKELKNNMLYYSTPAEQYEIVLNKCLDVLYKTLDEKKESRFIFTKSIVSGYLSEVIGLSLTDIGHAFCKDSHYESAVDFFRKEAEKIPNDELRLKYFKGLYNQYIDIIELSTFILEEYYNCLSEESLNSEEGFEIAYKLAQGYSMFKWYDDAYHFIEEGISIWNDFLESNGDVDIPFGSSFFMLAGYISDGLYCRKIDAEGFGESSNELLNNSISYYEKAIELAKNPGTIAGIHYFLSYIYNRIGMFDDMSYGYLKASINAIHPHYGTACLSLAVKEILSDDYDKYTNALAYINLITEAFKEYNAEDIGISEDNIILYHNIYANCLYMLGAYKEAYDVYNMLRNDIKDKDEIMEWVSTPIAEALQRYLHLGMAYGGRYSHGKTYANQHYTA